MPVVRVLINSLNYKFERVFKKKFSKVGGGPNVFCTSAHSRYQRKLDYGLRLRRKKALSMRGYRLYLFAYIFFHASCRRDNETKQCSARKTSVYKMRKG